MPSNSAECFPCSNSTYSAGNQDKCCQHGQTYLSGTCVDCPLSTSMSHGGGECIACSIGSYSDITGATKCRSMSFSDRLHQQEQHPQALV
jgi:hypothetical protein